MLGDPLRRSRDGRVAVGLDGTVLVVGGAAVTLRSRGAICDRLTVPWNNSLGLELKSSSELHHNYTVDRIFKHNVVATKLLCAVHLRSRSGPL